LATLNARYNVTFKDFEAMKTNPLSQHILISVADLIKKLSGKSVEELSKFEAMEGPTYEITKDSSPTECAAKQAINLFNTLTEVLADFDVE